MSQANAAHSPALHAGPGPQAALLREIESCRRRMAFQALTRRLLAMVALAAVPPLLFVVADHTQPSGVPRSTTLTLAFYWRLALGAAFLALLGYTLGRRLSLLFAAREVERASGIEHNSLVNAVLLQRPHAAVYASSAAAEQAATELARHWPPRVAAPGALRLPLTLCGCVLLAWLGYALLASKSIWPSVARFWGADMPAPTATVLEQVRPRPGEAVHAGEPLELEFTARGGVVQAVSFEMLGSGAVGGKRYAMRPAAELGGAWQLTLTAHEVIRDIDYRVTANDAVLTGVIPVLPLPALTGLEIELQPPAYSGLPVSITNAPDLDVLVGTRATFRAFANTSVSNATFIFTNEHQTRTRMEVDENDPYRFAVSMLLVESGEYRIEFRDVLGAALKDPPTNRIELRSDAAPDININEPPESEAPDGIVDVSKQAVLVATAQDDLRLEEIAIILVDGGVQMRTTLKPELDLESRRGRARVQTSSLPIKPGQQVRVWFEARDNHVLPDGISAPHTGRSRELVLTRPGQLERSRRNATGKDTPAPQQAVRPPSDVSAEQRAGTGVAGDETPAPEAGASEEQSEKAGDSPKGDRPDGNGFGRALKRFVEENGEMARDFGRRIPGPDSNGNSNRDDQSGSQSQPSDSSSTENTQAGPSASQPAEQGQTSAAQPQSSPEPAPQAAGGSCDKPDSKPCSSGTGSGAREASQDSGAADGDSTASPPSEQHPDTNERQPVGENAPGDAQKAEPSSAEPGTSNQPSGDSQVRGAGTGDSGMAPAAESQPAQVPSPPEQQDRRDREPPLESEGLTETLDLLEWLDRGGTLDESLLTELGWPADKAAGFVKSLKLLHEMARHSGSMGQLRVLRINATALGDPSVQQGSGLAGDARTAVEQTRPREDNLRRIAPPPEQEVSPELRLLLDAYYRALAQRQENP